MKYEHILSVIRTVSSFVELTRYLLFVMDWSTFHLLSLTSQESWTQEYKVRIHLLL